MAEAERRLVAIFAADVEGLMRNDEAATFRDLTECRQILDRLIASHRGRIANTAGDSVLAEVPEGAEYTSGTFGNRGETIQLATYGKTFPITRQAIINDDLSVFSRVPRYMGRAAKRTIGNLVYAVLTANAVMSDNIALFHEDHANLAESGGAPDVTTLDTARAAMAKQQDPDGHASAGLNIRPRYFIVPVALEVNRGC